MFCSTIWIHCLRHTEVRNSTGPKTRKSQFLLSRKQASSRLPLCTERSYTDATERCATDRLLHLCIVLLRFLLQCTSLPTGMLLDNFASDKRFVLVAIGDWKEIQYQKARGDSLQCRKSRRQWDFFSWSQYKVFGMRWLQKLLDSLFCEPKEPHRNKPCERNIRQLYVWQMVPHSVPLP
jgi:hypothetical protein